MLPLFAKRSATRGASTNKRAHVAVCPFVQPPHPETFFLLSRNIAAANRDVQVSMFTSVPYAMYLYNYWDPEVDGNLHFLAVGDWPPSNATQEEINKAYMEEAGENLRKSMAEAEKEFGLKISYVWADAFLAGVCREIAEERGVGWSAVWISSAASVAAFMHGDEILRKINKSNPPGRPPTLPRPVDQYLPGFPPGVLTSELPQGALSGPESSDKMFRNMVRALPKADVVLVHSFHHLETSMITSGLLAPNFHIGRFLPHNGPILPYIELFDNTGMLPWLDARLSAPGSVVYINLGNSATHDMQGEFHALAEALEATGLPFLWYVARTWPRVELPQGFVERTSKSGQGKVVTTSSGMVRFMMLEREVMRHKAVGAQLRETSWWTVSETIDTGKPIICRPMTQLFDQALNAALVDRVWGIGVAVENNTLTKETAKRALRRVMVDEEGWKIKERVAGIKKLAEDDAAEPNGGSAQALNKFISLVTK